MIMSSTSNSKSDSKREHTNGKSNKGEAPAAPSRSVNVQFQSRTLKVEVVSAAVSEHSQQIHRNLTTPVMQFFAGLYREAKKEVESPPKSENNGENKAPTGLNELQMFQMKLKGIPKWDDKTKERVSQLITSWIPNRRFDLAKVLKTIVVGRTMLLASVAGRGDGDLDKVRVELPDMTEFIFNTVSLASQQLYRFPSLLRIDPDKPNEADLDLKQTRVRAIVKDSIDHAILDLLPSDSLNSYLESSLHADHYSSTPVATAAADLNQYGFEKEGAEGKKDKAEDAETPNEDSKDKNKTKKVNVPAPSADPTNANAGNGNDASSADKEEDNSGGSGSGSGSSDGESESESDED